jgi:hypothetical protein
MARHAIACRAVHKVKATIAVYDQRRAFGSFIPPGVVPPEAARELTFMRSSVVVPVPAVREPGEEADEDVELSRITVRSRPRKSAARIMTTRTTTAIMPHTPPGKLRVVLVVVVISVPVVVVPVVVGAVVPVVVGCPVDPVACGLAFASVPAVVAGAVLVF